ncbi:MAG: hypothetical protein JWR69_1085 [Pedosphaera sp.]|nr:hypothetical protein [Pedosphaera sp.]
MANLNPPELLRRTKRFFSKISHPQLLGICRAELSQDNLRLGVVSAFLPCTYK